MKILCIVQYFSTRDGNSGTRGFEFARRFVRAGHEVTVLTSASAYSHLAGQTEWIRRQNVEGIDVISLGIGYAQRMSYVRRAVSFALFLVASTLYGIFLPRRDLVFATSTPLSVGLTGAIISMARGVPFVFEVRDLWPRAPIEMGVIRNPVLKTLLLFVEGWIYRRSTRVCALSPGIAEGVIARGVSPERVRVVPNASDADLAPKRVDRSAVRRRFGLPADCFLVVYAGALGPANNLGEILEAARLLEKQGAKRPRFLILGEGSESENLKGRAKTLGLSNVVFGGSFTRSEAAEIIAAADLGVTCFSDLPVLQTNSPNKFFDYMALGVGQMVTTRGWMRDVIEESGGGFFWPPGKPEVAAEKILELEKKPERLAAMKKAAKRLAAKRFERGMLSEKLLGLFHEAVREPLGGWPIWWQGAFDRTTSLAGLLILSPAFLAIALAIRKEDGGPVFFRPERIGLGGRRFAMFKFRTMIPGATKEGLGLNVSEGDERITNIGRFLRKWSLDELPQLLNVFLGDMRLVGPRPALAEHAGRYTPEQTGRLRVRPGITGWAQVNGRNLLSWDEKIGLDLWDVGHRSFLVDLRILAKTLRVVLRREGLYEPEAGLSDTFNRFKKDEGGRMKDENS